MHKTISTKVQGKTSFETKLNNVDQTFWFSTFYVVFGFLTQKKEKIDQNQQKEINDRMQKQTKISTLTIDKQTIKQNHKA